MKLETLGKLFEDQLKDVYSAETQLTKALPKMAKAASTPALKDAFTAHLEETKGQKERLDQIGEMLGIKMTGKKCKAMEGLIEEGKEVLDAEGPGPVLDAALIASAQRIEHYEIAAYGTIRTLAEHLGHKKAVELLDKTAQEEGDADKKLTSIAERDVYPSIGGDAASDGKAAAPKKASPKKAGAKTSAKKTSPPKASASKTSAPKTSAPKAGVKKTSSKKAK